MRWISAAIAAGLSVTSVAGHLHATVPSPFFSTVECSCEPDPASGGASLALPYRCTISPSGGAGGTDPSDDIRIAVTVMNLLGEPLVGSTVVASHAGIGGAVFRWDDGLSPAGDLDEDPQLQVSDASGGAFFLYDEGGVAILAGAGGSANLGFAVTAQGPGPGGPVALPDCSPNLVVHAYDLDADAGGDVDLADFGLFASYFTAGDARADFNHVGGVTLADFGLFAANFGADLDAQ